MKSDLPSMMNLVSEACDDGAGDDDVTVQCVNDEEKLNDLTLPCQVCLLLKLSHWQKDQCQQKHYHCLFQ